jgi:hypothetical protein
MITQIEYVVNSDGANKTESISKTTYNDYFKVGEDDYAKIFKANN